MNLPIHDDSLGRISEPPTVCHKLRTKTAFGPYLATGEDYRTGDSTTAVYWCLATMATWGPDEHLAHPHHCREGRGCFRKPMT